MSRALATPVLKARFSQQATELRYTSPAAERDRRVKLILDTNFKPGA